jgi:hypothetical protein
MQIRYYTTKETTHLVQERVRLVEEPTPIKKNTSRQIHIDPQETWYTIKNIFKSWKID